MGEQRTFQLPSETSILEVFENPAINGKFLILGKPGSGKTTTLLELAQALIERAETDSDAPIPVILELSEWRTVTKGWLWNKEEYNPSIKEWILSQLRSKGVSQEIGEQWIREKELVLLLDGLDELPSERQAKCVQAINQFLDSEFSPLHLVVGSRKEEYEKYEEVLRLNGAICLEDLTVEQMRHYFASVNLGEFWESIKDSEKIVNFIRQPLFLAITSIAYQQIDVEEWKNCNTEEKAIDYLLGIYRVEMLRKTSKSKWYSRKQPLAWKSQNILIRLAQYLDNTKNPQKEFRVNRLQGYILPENKISIPIRLTFYFSLLILFPIFLLLTLIDSQVSILMGLIICVSYVINCSKEGWKITFVRIKTFNPFNVLLTFIALFVCALLPLLFLIFIFIVEYFPTYLPIYGLDVFPYTLAMLREVGGDWFVWVISLLAGFSILTGFGYNEDEIINEDDEITSRPGNIFLNSFLASVVFFAVGMLSGFIPSLKFGTIIALGNGTLLGLIFSSLAWWDSIKYLVLRLTLWLTDQMPWNITRFLDYCTERLILQRVGNRYRFIHRLVQEHFANLEIQKE